MSARAAIERFRARLVSFYDLIICGSKSISRETGRPCLKTLCPGQAPDAGLDDGEALPVIGGAWTLMRWVPDQAGGAIHSSSHHAAEPARGTLRMDNTPPRHRIERFIRKLIGGHWRQQGWRSVPP